MKLRNPGERPRLSAGTGRPLVCQPGYIRVVNGVMSTIRRGKSDLRTLRADNKKGNGFESSGMPPTPLVPAGRMALREGEMRQLIRRQLELVGEDPDRDGLRRTPKRAAEALKFFTRGYQQDPKTV